MMVGDRRQSLEFTPTADDATSAYRLRRTQYRYSQLVSVWFGCPECGGFDLLRPNREQLHVIPETTGVCADCLSPFMLGHDFRPHRLHARAVAARRLLTVADPSERVMSMAA
jgi:hypothetical protein